MKEVHIVSRVDLNDPSRTHVLGCYLDLDKAKEYAAETACDAPSKFTRLSEREWTTHHAITIESFYLND